MYELLRRLLIATVLLVAYMAALMICMVPFGWLVIVVIGIAALCRRTYRYTAMGTARWAELTDLEDMIDE